ncbi:hypothetical protein QFZ52_001388 [Arthrobacter woluwensis]|uniref:DUF6228 family protein n=1 Tax=Arthrobacter woluwensis TaxID=156980 RepID=UPI00277F3354|nr:DUF6228 family protein [Arthrobacter woluwensis]MDQ0708736.1 hypothetical protein [Arthrobacter woluwensis]
MNELAIGHVGALRLSADDGLRDGDGTVDSLTVEVNLNGLRAVKSVYDFDRWSGLLAFFKELASGWRGWTGEKTFDSLEGDFTLAATHIGHIRIVVELKDRESPTPWSTVAELSVDPGEELSAAATGLRELLAPALG